MTSQDPETSSDYGWRESDGQSSSRFSLKKTLIAIAMLVVIMGSPWWVTAIPEFGFTEKETGLQE